METYNISDMVGGWFVGDFSPSVRKTKDFEVCYKVHEKDEVWDTHYHKIATEINYLIRGTMSINGQILNEGTIFVIPKYEVSAPKFLTRCELIVVKTPSVIGDKFNDRTN